MYSPITCGYKKENKKKRIGHHARPRRASATAPRRTGADMCKTRSAAGKCARAKSNTVRRRSNHAQTEDQAGREKRANTDASGGWRVHTAVDAPRRNAATRSKHLSYIIACLQVLSRSNVATAIALEILRLKAPVAAVFRKAARDTTVQGIAVPKGTSVMVSMRTVRMMCMHTVCFAAFTAVHASHAEAEF